MQEESLRQLILNCRRPRFRSIGLPHEWTPQKVELPDLPGFNFSDAAAWDLIAEKLSCGHPYDEILLKVPPGALAITMRISIAASRPPVYVKVQIGMGNLAIGRSFHYSDFA
jgi:hypothetical protein